MDELETTSLPTGFVPAAIRYENKSLCVTACDGVPTIVRRPVRSRSDYRSGVMQDGPLPGVVAGQDFVPGVAPPSGSGMLRVPF